MAARPDEEIEKKRLRALAIQRLTQKYGRPFLVFMMDEKLQSNNRAVPDQVQQLTKLIKDDTKLPDLAMMKDIAMIAEKLQSGSLKVADILPLQRNNEDLDEDETKSDMDEEYDTADNQNFVPDNLNQQVIILQDKLRKLEEINQELVKENKVLTDFINNNNNEYNQLLRQKVQLSEQNKKRQEALAEMMDKLKYARDEIARLQGNSNVSTVPENEELLERLREENGRAKQLQKYLEIEEKNSKNLKGQVDDLTEKLRQCERSATGNELKQKLKKCEKISKDLQKQLRNNEDFINGLKANNDEKVKRIEKAKDQTIKDLKENMKNLRKKIKESNSEKLVTDDIERLKKLLQRCKQDNVTKEQTIKELENEIYNFQKSFEKYQIDQQDAEGKIERLQKKMQEYEQVILALENDLQYEQEECKKEKERMRKKANPSRPRRSKTRSDSGTSATDTDSDSKSVQPKPEVPVKIEPLKSDCITTPPKNFKSVSEISKDKPVAPQDIVNFAKKNNFDPNKIRLYTGMDYFFNYYYCRIYDAFINAEGDCFVKVVNQNKVMEKLKITKEIFKNFYVNGESFTKWYSDMGKKSQSTKFDDLDSSGSGTSATDTDSDSSSSVKPGNRAQLKPRTLAQKTQNTPVKTEPTNEYLLKITKKDPLFKLLDAKQIQYNTRESVASLKQKVRKAYGINDDTRTNPPRRARKPNLTEEEIASFDFMSMSDRFVMDYEEGVTPALYSARIPERDELM